MLSTRPAMRPLKASIFQLFLTYRCLYSTHNTSSPSDAASKAAADFLARFQSQGPQLRTQLLDANQLHLLSLTLNRPKRQLINYPGASTTAATVTSSSPSLPVPSNGSPVPPGHHLVYFTPGFLEEELGADGTDTSYNPDVPFTRRMWAGGEVSWPRGADGKPNLLRVGQEVTESTKVLSAEPKVVRKTGEAMIVVGVEKMFSNEYGVAVIDRRNWLFREALPYPPKPYEKKAETKPPVSKQNKTPAPSNQAVGVYKRYFNQTAVTLFRFSALTFNTHKIHYSVPWSQEVEGHRNIVVHGPLNLVSMLDFWRDIQHEKANKNSSSSSKNNQDHPDISLIVPQRISYRATNPLYAEEDYEIVLEEARESSSVNIFNHDGVVSMKAEIEA
ncbi:hypothetical protein UA08_08118 [Talaromyces atroroseus]|uniref:Mesaconyl-C(4)-CoA hydratase n=1 Tax=Talaromyces atroroseus TaxID=1441469 RepID=A0A225A7F0_TALAT|nr:hypothetical protein UA08_08118 [Talaromyces atroroseus]OKL56422.1 hypothetical protein UA08_08118 [Talaromyces atroroseus]